MWLALKHQITKSNRILGNASNLALLTIFVCTFKSSYFKVVLTNTQNICFLNSKIKTIYLFISVILCYLMFCGKFWQPIRWNQKKCPLQVNYCKVIPQTGRWKKNVNCSLYVWVNTNNHPLWRKTGKLISNYLHCSFKWNAVSNNINTYLIKSTYPFVAP